MRVAVVANAGDDDDGFVGACLGERGATFVRYHRDDPNTLQRGEEDVDLLVLLGSDWSVYDVAHLEAVRAEQALVQRAQQRGLPVLGICFGGQLIASVLGLSVTPTQRPEIGWHFVDTEDENLCPKGPWFQYHFDRWTDAGAVHSIARSAAGPQAFWYGRSLALQFHPEVTPTMATQWLDNGRIEATALGVDVDKIIDETSRYADAAEQRCRLLVDRFLETMEERDYPALGS